MVVRTRSETGRTVFPNHTALCSAEWRPLALAHAARADAFTVGWRERRQTGEKHPIEDFLFTYYPTKPAHLRRWHPGPDVVLLGSPEELAERVGWRWYSSTNSEGHHSAGLNPSKPMGLDRVRAGAVGNQTAAVHLDTGAFLADRRDTVTYIRDLVSRTRDRRANHGCFGLHEWAMVFRERDETRHPLPLRLGAAGTDAVVDAHPIRCSHFDAFRFFTPEAVSLNRLQPTRESQPDLEQPGCLHAGMDLFKWASKLSPGISSNIVLDAFELARDIRTVDMQASPYDVSDFGLPAIAIESAEGKSEYAARQREFTARAQPLRNRIVEACDQLLGGPEL